MASVKSIIETGSDSSVITVECHLANSLPGIVIVGYASKSVDEAKERIRGALANCGFALPPKRIIFNLAPADLPKYGSSFDLPMLVAVLSSTQRISITPDHQTAVIGEVGLDGTVRAVRGIIGKLMAAKRHGINYFWIPEANFAQASLVPGVLLKCFKTIKQLIYELNGSKIDSSTPSKPDFRATPLCGALTIDDIAGQDSAKRALTVAAAGNHNVLLSGPPGSGKSMLAKAIISLLPPLSLQETLEVTQLHSLANKNFGKIVSQRPFRSPHHSASAVSVLGGGTGLQPGEVSLSHKGILLFDEFPEFSRQIIESLRQPLEDKYISVSRLKSSARLPADFLFIATANSCPCGNYGGENKCTCSAKQITNYQKKISGPVIDRIDIRFTPQAVKHKNLLKAKTDGSETKKLKQQVWEARQKQLRRQGKLNSSLEANELEAACQMNLSTRRAFEQAAGEMNLSARGYVRSLKVARTIADMDASGSVSHIHIAEALRYRQNPYNT